MNLPIPVKRKLANLSSPLSIHLPLATCAVSDKRVKVHFQKKVLWNFFALVFYPIARHKEFSDLASYTIFLLRFFLLIIVN
jgi:hypothetical protein